MAGYYDYVLGIIPIALFGITGALYLGGIGLTAAVPAGAVVAVGVMGHAMFVRAPGEHHGSSATESPGSGGGFQSAD